LFLDSPQNGSDQQLGRQRITPNGATVPISLDGAVIVGAGDPVLTEPCCGPHMVTRLFSVSCDGTPRPSPPRLRETDRLSWLVVDSAGNYCAFHWTQQTGMVNLGNSVTGFFASVASHGDEGRRADLGRRAQFAAFIVDVAPLADYQRWIGGASVASQFVSAGTSSPRSTCRRIVRSMTRITPGLQRRPKSMVPRELVRLAWDAVACPAGRRCTDQESCLREAVPDQILAFQPRQRHQCIETLRWEISIPIGSTKMQLAIGYRGRPMAEPHSITHSEYGCSCPMHRGVDPSTLVPRELAQGCGVQQFDRAP
jgi:hypothetical protein